MSTFTYVADYPVEERSQPRVREYSTATYSQRAPDGIQLLRDTWSVTFSARDDTDRNGILSFFEALNGTDSFQWTTPFNETAQFLCPDWDVSLDFCGLSTVSATFVLTYVPGQTNLSDTAAPSTAFTYIPEFTAQQTYKSRTKQITFGDGYTQRLSFGLHPQQESWSLTFNNRTNAQRDLIRTYLRGAAQISSFTWQTPLGATEQFVCKDWTVRYNNYNNSSIRAEFERVFEP